MTRAVGALALVICALAALAFAAPGPAAKHFSHAAHAERRATIDPRGRITGAGNADGTPAGGGGPRWIDKCETCHDVDAKGQVTAPAALGHSPCQSMGCHAADFVAVGDKARKADPDRYASATAFCLGCYDTKDGAPPAPWSWPTTNAAL